VHTGQIITSTVQGKGEGEGRDDLLPECKNNDVDKKENPQEKSKRGRHGGTWSSSVLLVCYPHRGYRIWAVELFARNVPDMSERRRGKQKRQGVHHEDACP
jgi:hypothetical protein